MMWRTGQLVMVESDLDFGLSRVVNEKHPKIVQVESLKTGERRNYSKVNAPLRRIEFRLGQRLMIRTHTEPLQIQSLLVKDHLTVFTTPKGIFTEADVVEVSDNSGVIDLLNQGKFTPLKAFFLRQRAHQLLALQQNHPLRGLAGCRVDLLPHQIWVASQALGQKRVRALLSDEVGLGKTIEAGLITSALHAQGRLKKVLILVPQALKVQWLSEFFRRFNLRFRLDHEDLMDEDDFREFYIASFEELTELPENLDLLIVDEAHRLAADTSRATLFESVCRAATHALFLTATPEIFGREHLKKMLGLLKSPAPDAEEPMVFRSRRSEMGFGTQRQLEAQYVSTKLEWTINFLLQAVSENRKVFLITSTAEQVEVFYKKFVSKLGQKFAKFHEGMDLIERDRQAAYFADPEGALFLIASEVGGEGRNFQFCSHMVLLDLPHDPWLIEQRIGRLDRIGQKNTVHIWVPVLESSDEEAVFETLKDKYQVFAKPWTGASVQDNTTLEETIDSASIDQLRQPFLRKQAQQILKSVDELSRVDVRDLLVSIYDLFGAHVEDFDSLGSIVASSSSLMFVDRFPSLIEQGERSITFDRSLALAREEVSYFSVDHPEFIEVLEFLIGSEQGQLCQAKDNGAEPLAASLIALLKMRGDTHHTTVAISLKPKLSVRQIDGDLSNQLKDAPNLWPKIPTDQKAKITQALTRTIDRSPDIEGIDALIVLSGLEFGLSSA
jgi:ATP-dependent helicase HepA